MATTLVDTSAWIHSLRPGGDPEVTARVRALLESGDAAWCPVVRLELWNGARGQHESSVLREMEKELTDFPIGPEVWTSAEEIARRARRSGKTVPATDILVEACARHHGVALEHADEHFTVLAAL